MNRYDLQKVYDETLNRRCHSALDDALMQQSVLQNTLTDIDFAAKTSGISLHFGRDPETDIPMVRAQLNLRVVLTTKYHK